MFKKKDTVKFYLLDGTITENAQYKSVCLYADLPDTDGNDLFIFVRRDSGERLTACGKYEYPRGFYRRGAAGSWQHTPMIKYEYAQGDVHWVEVADELWVDIKEIEYGDKLSDARNTGANLRYRVKQADGSESRKKAGTHISLSDFDVIDDAALIDGTDILGDICAKETARELREGLRRGVESLNPKERELLYKRFIKKLKAKDIAREAGVSEAHISQQTKKIRAKLANYVCLQG